MVEPLIRLGSEKDQGSNRLMPQRAVAVLKRANEPRPTAQPAGTALGCSSEMGCGVDGHDALTESRKWLLPITARVSGGAGVGAAEEGDGRGSSKSASRKKAQGGVDDVRLSCGRGG